MEAAARLAAIREAWSVKLPARLASLREALQEAHRGDEASLDRAIREAHNLHGTAGSYGHGSVSEVAGRIEDALRSDGGSAVPRALSDLSGLETSDAG